MLLYLTASLIEAKVLVICEYTSGKVMSAFVMHAVTSGVTGPVYFLQIETVKDLFILKKKNKFM